jgi:hypothetical protein
MARRESLRVGGAATPPARHMIEDRQSGPAVPGGPLRPTSGRQSSLTGFETVPASAFVNGGASGAGLAFRHCRMSR